jgi:hydrogenase expression/formation protein HypC
MVVTQTTVGQRLVGIGRMEARMCLAVPMRLVERKNDSVGIVELSGVRREVHLGFIEDLKVGDYVLIHAGFAIEKLTAERAEADLKLLNDLYDQSPREGS